MDIAALRKEIELLDVLLSQVLGTKPVDPRGVAAVCDESHARQVLIKLLEINATLTA